MKGCFEIASLSSIGIMKFDLPKFHFFPRICGIIWSLPFTAKARSSPLGGHGGHGAADDSWDISIYSGFKIYAFSSASSPFPSFKLKYSAACLSIDSLGCITASQLQHNQKITLDLHPNLVFVFFPLSLYHFLKLATLIQLLKPKT